MNDFRSDSVPIKSRQKMAMNIIAKAQKTNTAELLDGWLDKILKADHADVLEFLDKQAENKKEFETKQAERWKNMRPSEHAEELEP